MIPSQSRNREATVRTPLSVTIDSSGQLRRKRQVMNRKTATGRQFDVLGGFSMTTSLRSAAVENGMRSMLYFIVSRNNRAGENRRQSRIPAGYR
jgi:hypothetical protein